MLKYTLYLLVTCLFVVGLFFKFFHWPGAGLMIVGSLSLIALTLLGYSFTKIKSKPSFRAVCYPVLGIAFVLGILFKIMHWPGANILLILSYLGMAVAFLEYALRVRKSIMVAIPILFSIVLVSILFKILHWPQSTIILLGSFCCFSGLVPILTAYRAYRQKDESKTISNHMFGVSIISLIYFLLELYFVIFGDGLATGGSYRLLIVMLLFALVLVVGNVIRNSELKSKSVADFNILKLLGVSFMIILIVQALVSGS
jgi:hypothetical protein